MYRSGRLIENTTRPFRSEETLDSRIPRVRATADKPSSFLPCARAPLVSGGGWDGSNVHDAEAAHQKAAGGAESLWGKGGQIEPLRLEFPPTEATRPWWVVVCVLHLRRPHPLPRALCSPEVFFF